MADVAKLQLIVRAMKVPAQRLAVALGNFHGTNDFAYTKPKLDCGFILDDIQKDLIEVVLLRSCALLVGDQPTDATLALASKWLDRSELRDELFKAAKNWKFPNEIGGRQRATRLPERLDRFRQVVSALDFASMRSHRNWVLAHSTTKKPPPVTFISVWKVAAAVLGAYDDLHFVTFGDDLDVTALASGRREQSKFFWDHIRAPAKD